MLLALIVGLGKESAGRVLIMPVQAATPERHLGCPGRTGVATAIVCAISGVRIGREAALVTVRRVMFFVFLSCVSSTRKERSLYQTTLEVTRVYFVWCIITCTFASVAAVYTATHAALKFMPWCRDVIEPVLQARGHPMQCFL